MTDRQTNYNSIDLMKFICSLLVVLIHCVNAETLNNTTDLINYVIRNVIARIAVPLFFISSGFFLYRKTTLNEFSLKHTKEYVIKLLRFYIIWSLIYLPLSIEKILQNEQGVVHAILEYLRDFVFISSYVHLWYLPATIFAVLLVSYLISKKVDLKRILLISSIFYFIGLFGQSWFGLFRPFIAHIPYLVSRIFNLTIRTTRNGLFDAFIFVTLGANIAFNGFNFKQNKAILLFLISFALLNIEAIYTMKMDFILTNSNDMYFFLVPVAYFAFGIISNIHLNGKVCFYKILRIISSLIYFVHYLIRYLILKFFAFLSYPMSNSYLLFVIVSLASIAVSYIIYMFSQKKYFKWMKNLYS